MHKMGGFNVDASLAYFEDHGGYCDSEIFAQCRSLVRAAR
jgi:hypothetical protein